eukprot:15466164-Alexandrium_andersonii.AAC.1
MERLIRSNLRHVSLARQSRMHPDISALLLPTYPFLQDNTSVVAGRRRAQRQSGITHTHKSAIAMLGLIA